MNNIYIYYNFDRQNSQLKKLKKKLLTGTVTRVTIRIRNRDD